MNETFTQEAGSTMPRSLVVGAAGYVDSNLVPAGAGVVVDHGIDIARVQRYCGLQGPPLQRAAGTARDLLHPPHMYQRRPRQHYLGQ